jgi:hypothetical protein
MKRTLLLTGFVFGIGCLVDAQERGGRNESNRPVGTWEQSNGDNTLTLTVTADRLHITATGKEKKTLWLIDADYSVTKDSILYGIVTSIENGSKLTVASQRPQPAMKSSSSPSLVPAPAPLLSVPNSEADRSMPLGLCVDDLFSFRFRADDDILTIKATKAKTTGGRSEFPLEGRFKKIPDSENRLLREKGDFEKKDIPKEKYKYDEKKSAENHRQLAPPSQRVSVGELSVCYGEGHILLRGQEFQAQAESITYDEQNNRLTLVGSKDNPVTFTILRAGSIPQCFRGTKIVISRRTGRIEGVNITSIRG